MLGVIRTYSGQGAAQLFDLLESRKAEIEGEFRKVKGFQSYTLMRTPDGGISVTVCNDKAGLDESVSLAKNWLGKNATAIGYAAPKVSEGTVVIHAK